MAIIKNIKIKSLIFALLSVGAISVSQAATFYVKSDAIGNGNGSSWAKAFNNIDAALNAAKLTVGPDQIWVAKGTYKPSIKYSSGGYTGNESNLVTFNLPNNVALLGGFKGDEKSPSQRNPSYNKTVLSGDINNDDINDPQNTKTNKSDNAWHVLTADGVKGVIVDGFTVSGGFASGPDAGTTSGRPQITLESIAYLHSGGAGLLAVHQAQVILNNMVFEYNGSDATHSQVRGNEDLGSPSIVSGGGAIAAVDESTLVIINASSFDHNNAYEFGGNGGAISAKLESSVNILLSSFTNNSADRNGGGIHGKDAEKIKVSASKFENNIITGSAIGDESGGGIGVINTNLDVSVSSFKNNVGGALAGGGGIFFHVPLDDGEIYQLNVIGSEFSNNRASFIGGGAINIFGTKPKVGSKATVSACVFNDNSAINGGALYVDSIPTVISKSVFNGNKANFSGGAIFASNFGDAIFSSGPVSLNDRSLLNISTSQFKQNTIVGANPGEPPTPFIFNIFANALSNVFGKPLASVSTMASGGGAIAASLGSNINIATSTFANNSAPNANGGALLIGGSAGTPEILSQNYVKISKSVCSNNTASVGNNKAVIDAGNLSNHPNGVQYVTDGSCP